MAAITVYAEAHAKALALAQSMRQLGFSERQIHDAYLATLNEAGIYSKRQWGERKEMAT